MRKKPRGVALVKLKAGLTCLRTPTTPGLLPKKAKYRDVLAERGLRGEAGDL